MIRWIFLEDQEKVLKRKAGTMAFCYTEENGKRSDLRFKTGWRRASSELGSPALVWVISPLCGLFGFPQERWDSRNPQFPSTSRGRKHWLWTSKDSHTQKVWNKYSHGSCHFAIEEIESEKVNYLPKVGVLTRVDSSLSLWRIGAEQVSAWQVRACALPWISNPLWTFCPFHSSTPPPSPAQGNDCVLGDFEESGCKPA